MKRSRKKKDAFLSSAFLAIFIVLLLVRKTSDNSTEHGNVNDVGLFNISPQPTLLNIVKLQRNHFHSFSFFFLFF